MGKLFIQDHTGDTQHEFKVDDEASVKDAERIFNEFMAKGHRAAAMSNDGSPGKLMRKFDATEEKILIFPQLQGG